MSRHIIHALLMQTIEFISTQKKALSTLCPGTDCIELFICLVIWWENIKCNKHIKKPCTCSSGGLLSHGTAEDLRLTNQQKGAFNSHPRRNRIFKLFILFLPLNEKRKLIWILVFRFFEKKWNKRKRSCFLIFLLSILNQKTSECSIPDLVF